MTPNEPLTGLYDGTGLPLDRMPDAILPATNGFVTNELGQILLQKRSDNGYWGLPGGKVDIGETLAQGAAREVMEEAGIEVKVGRLIGVYSAPENYSVLRYPSGYAVHYVTFLFECEYVSGDIAISDESTDIGYFAPDALPEDTLLSHRIRIKDALEHRVEPFVK